MTNDEKLLQQALEALELAANKLIELDDAQGDQDDSIYAENAIIRCRSSAQTLRDRLAQLEFDRAHEALEKQAGIHVSQQASAEPTRDDVITFLLGEAPLDGVWFGEKHPTYPGRFWWRAHLRKAIEPSAEPVAWFLSHEKASGQFCHNPPEGKVHIGSKRPPIGTGWQPLYTAPLKPEQAEAVYCGCGDQIVQDDDPKCGTCASLLQKDEPSAEPVEKET